MTNFERITLSARELSCWTAAQIIKALKCPKCKTDVYAEVYTEECYGKVEEHYKCGNCGYVRSWAYGVDFVTPEYLEGKGNE